jgi:hypothetical protein
MSSPLSPLRQPTRRVRLPVSARVASVGPYRPGQIVEVPADEAERLIRGKGFEPVDPAPVSGPVEADPESTLQPED